MKNDNTKSGINGVELLSSKVQLKPRGMDSTLVMAFSGDGVALGRLVEMVLEIIGDEG